MLVGVGNMLDKQILQQGAAMRTLVIFFYVANEGLSITENLQKMGVVIPRPLRDFLKKLRDENNKKKEDTKKKEVEETKEESDGNNAKESEEPKEDSTQ